MDQIGCASCGKLVSYSTYQLWVKQYHYIARRSVCVGCYYTKHPNLPCVGCGRETPKHKTHVHRRYHAYICSLGCERGFEWE